MGPPWDRRAGEGARGHAATADERSRLCTRERLVVCTSSVREPWRPHGGHCEEVRACSDDDAMVAFVRPRGTKKTARRACGRRRDAGAFGAGRAMRLGRCW